MKAGLVFSFFRHFLYLCIGIVVKLPCSVAVTDRATGVRRCLGDWTSRDIYLKSYYSDLAAIYLDYFYDYSLQDRCPYLL